MYHARAVTSTALPCPHSSLNRGDKRGRPLFGTKWESVAVKKTNAHAGIHRELGSLARAGIEVERDVD